MDQQFWDEMYGSRDQLFSGAPNGVLVTEVADLPPGQALDVGCGEGGDARWLARRGWQVTAVDISRTALQRAAAATDAEIAGRVAWGPRGPDRHAATGSCVRPRVRPVPPAATAA